ncbi:catalase-like protein [Dinothrombium tinctorium]|uniref:Catalase-like protein n=1 Tax=Dinothrombium tinctorium TaxID=1965070 RepID=A0A3S3PYA3_9ACAR|nr:catalase-like protein [Dinothrombium tinctorium]RWS10393.1 catalase-like protein [Dinothrombium tinctorium]RWS11226.1 catalase-like protein [Dinothrombium tinctorium]
MERITLIVILFIVQILKLNFYATNSRKVIARLGVNFNQLPINEPINKVITPLDRDGVATLNDNHAGMPNYYPNSFLNADFNSVYKESSYTLDESTVDRYDFDSKYDMMQATEFYKNLSIYDKCQLALNIAGHLKEAIPDIQRRMLNTIRAIDPDLSIDVKMYMKPKRGIQLAKSKNACLNSN